MNIFKAVSDFDGKESFFSDEGDAEAWADNKKATLHRCYCVERKLDAPPNCLCKTSQGTKECAAHTYQRTVVAHDVDHCPISANVYVEEVEVN